MGMFTAPGTSDTSIDAYSYYQDMVESYLYGDTTYSDDQIQALKDEIENSYDLTVAEIEDLISNFPANIRHSSVVATDTVVKATDWQTSFVDWYEKNRVVISLVQWVLIIILLIRKSN